MDDDVLAGTRVLVIGGNREDAESLRAQLSAAGSSSVDLVPSLELVAAQAAAAQPQVVLSLGDIDAEAVRLRLDPLGLGAAPPVVAVADLATDGQGLSPSGVRRMRLVLEHREMSRRLGELEAIVAGQVLAAFRDAEEIRVDTLRRLALAAEYRDDNSPEHTQRVAALAARMARHLGENDRLVALVRQAAPLHDLGKIAIPDSILLKPGRLEPEEFEVVKTHAVLGARVLSESSSEVLAVAEQIARSHHERWDGEGYPDGLSGTGIPLVARLVHVADVFDVLVHERPYKEAWTVEDAAGEIRAGAGTQFDPGVVAAFDALGAGSWTAGMESS
jgi:putative two-component system response regulator